jgi:RHS repeat-associated protein
LGVALADAAAIAIRKTRARTHLKREPRDVYASRDYNDRLQLVRYQLGTAGTPSANLCWVYNYYSSVSNPTSCTLPTQGTGDNGNIMGYFLQDNTASPTPNVGHTATFTYDAVNRLTGSVATGSQTHHLDYTYDPWGNGHCVTGGQTQGPCSNWTFDTSKNRINTSGITYDAAGHMTSDGHHTYQWDGDGRLVSVDGVAGQACQTSWTACYSYNALGQFVGKQVGSSYFEIAYDAFGNPIGLHISSGWSTSFVPHAGHPFVRYVNNTTYFLHVNHLSTTTFATDPSGATAQKSIYYPWGEMWAHATSGVYYNFAGMFGTDGETGNAPATYRRYQPRLYHWLSPDPLGGDITNPQSLNRYAYAMNNPTTLTDPLGLQSPPDHLKLLQESDDSNCLMNGMAFSCSVVLSAIQSGAAFRSPLGADVGTFKAELGPNGTTIIKQWVPGSPPTGYVPCPNGAAGCFMQPGTDNTWWAADHPGKWATFGEFGPSAFADFFSGPGHITVVTRPGSTPQGIGTPKTSSECSIYLQGGTESGKFLHAVCQSFPDTPRSQIMRGCLQALYNLTSGYLPLPLYVQTTPASLIDANSIIPGAGAHAVCLGEAFGIQ